MAKPRWNRLLRFVDQYFVRKLDAESGFTELELRAANIFRDVPTVVREWYQLVGKRPDVTSGCNCCMTTMEDLRTEDGFLSLCWESQMLWNCGVWSDAMADDPAAYFRSNELDLVKDYGIDQSLVESGSFVQISSSISNFLTDMVILQYLQGTIEKEESNLENLSVYWGRIPASQFDSIISELGCDLIASMPWGFSIFSGENTFLEPRLGAYITTDQSLHR